MSWTFHDRMVEKMTKEKAIVYIEHALNIPNNNTGLTVIDLETLREALTWADRKRGRWIKKEERVWYWYECSECGEKPLFRDGQRVLSDYCPNCGARME